MRGTRGEGATDLLLPATALGGVGNNGTTPGVADPSFLDPLNFGWYHLLAIQHAEQQMTLYVFIRLKTECILRLSRSLAALHFNRADIHIGKKRILLRPDHTAADKYVRLAESITKHIYELNIFLSSLCREKYFNRVFATIT